MLARARKAADSIPRRAATLDSEPSPLSLRAPGGRPDEGGPRHMMVALAHSRYCWRSRHGSCGDAIGHQCGKGRTACFGPWHIHEPLTEPEKIQCRSRQEMPQTRSRQANVARSPQPTRPNLPRNRPLDACAFGIRRGKCGRALTLACRLQRFIRCLRPHRDRAARTRILRTDAPRTAGTSPTILGRELDLDHIRYCWRSHFSS